MKKKISMKSRLLILILLCWFLPFFFIAGTNTYYLTSDRLENKIAKELQRLDFVDQNVVEQLDGAIEASREASYDGQLLASLKDYYGGKISRRSLLSSSYNYLRDHYSDEDTIRMALCWFREDPEGLCCSSYNSGTQATYALVREYWEEDHGAIRALSEDLGTRIAFYQSGDKLYLLRNLCTRTYENAGTLVFLLNTEQCFRQYEAFPDGVAVTLLLDDCVLPVSGKALSREQVGLTPERKEAFGYDWDRNQLCAFHNTGSRDYSLTSLVRCPASTLSDLLHSYQNVFFLMLVSLVPLLLLFLLGYHRHVVQPVQSLMRGAEEISQGNLGYQLEEEPGSREFSFLVRAFNAMSQRIKYQFDHITKEEIALRDARIKALQLHINPHFMNNTLEIINWEARLSGNEKISKMIEALGTLMNAGLDRENRRIIPLSEEMTYVNAYLYISKARLGDRLTVINELPEEFMNYLVPRLILQPVVENAIEHGVAQRGKGTVILYGSLLGDKLSIEITNESVLSEADRAKIRKLLDVDYDTCREGSANIGISNVNQRLKMLYGGDCGLTVEQIDEEHVCARLLLKAEEI